jgi:hypothetical protein
VGDDGVRNDKLMVGIHVLQDKLGSAGREQGFCLLPKSSRLTVGTKEYSLAQEYVFKLIKPGYMFQLYSNHQAYLQSLVELDMLNA